MQTLREVETQINAVQEQIRLWYKLPNLMRRTAAQHMHFVNLQTENARLWRLARKLASGAHEQHYAYEDTLRKPVMQDYVESTRQGGLRVKATEDVPTARQLAKIVLHEMAKAA